MINLFSIDDHPMFIEGVVSTLKKYEKNVRVIGNATTCKEAITELKTMDVDIVLQDLLMPVINGAECCKLIKESYPNIKVIALTGELNPVLLHEAWKNGIDSIVLKGSGGDELYQAIRAVTNGRRLFSKGLPEFIFPVKECTSGALPKLTVREREVLMCLAKNTNRKQVTDELFLSPRGLKFHITNLNIKFNTSNMAELLSKAKELRYIN